jgi:spectinomycin phosphotransferase
MRKPPADLAESDLVAALRAGWGLDAATIEFLPVGAGSHHWSVAGRWFAKVDDLGFHPPERPAEFARIRASLRTAFSLREDSGLDFVLAPLPDESGEVLRRLSPRYALSLYPLLQGESGAFAPHPPADRAEIATMLARLHTAPLAGAVTAPRLDLGVPGRDKLEAALGELDRPWDAGPDAERARALLASRATDIHRWLADIDQLAAAQPADWVLTHGEPHPGNVLRTRAGRFLIDWNTVAIAPPERDLWMLTGRFATLVGATPDGDDTVLRRYAELTGRAVTAAALDLYPARWALYDIAVFTDELRRGEDRPESLAYLRGYLGASSPFR